MRLGGQGKKESELGILVYLNCDAGSHIFSIVQGLNGSLGHILRLHVNKSKTVEHITFSDHSKFLKKSSEIFRFGIKRKTANKNFRLNKQNQVIWLSFFFSILTFHGNRLKRYQ